MPRKRLEGKVISDKMTKTVIVTVDRFFAHPVYGKLVKVTKRFKAHDEWGARVGDEVTIEETRPLSKGKRWRVVVVGGKPVTTEAQKGKGKSEAVKRKGVTTRSKRRRVQKTPKR